jgi:hypothetical protein
VTSAEQRGHKRKISAANLAGLATPAALGQLGRGGGGGGGGGDDEPPRKRPKRGVQQEPRNNNPTLSAFPDGAGTEGPCGGFTRKRRWRVDNPVAGVIIQMVTRTFAVEHLDGTGSWTAINGGALDTYVTDPDSSVHADCTHYWELWRVRDDGTIIHNEDKFTLCSLIPDKNARANTTKGSFTITGVATFYPTRGTPASLGFTQDSVAAAGMLFARDDDPAGDINHLNAVGDNVTYTVVSTWDTSDPTRGPEFYSVII